MDSASKSVLLRVSQEVAGRWIVPILLAMHENGERFTPLQQRLGISPARLSDNLKELQELGMIVHLNPYERRHPLLPEYTFTEKGRLFRQIAEAVHATERGMHMDLVLTKKWNLPVLFSLLSGAHRFVDIKGEVPSVTSKMLTARLGELQDVALVEKKVILQPQMTQLYLLSEVAHQPVSALAADILSLAV